MWTKNAQILYKATVSNEKGIEKPVLGLSFDDDTFKWDV